MEGIEDPFGERTLTLFSVRALGKILCKFDPLPSLLLVFIAIRVLLKRLQPGRRDHDLRDEKKAKESRKISFFFGMQQYHSIQSLI